MAHSDLLWPWLSGSPVPHLRNAEDGSGTRPWPVFRVQDAAAVAAEKKLRLRETHPASPAPAAAQPGWRSLATAPVLPDPLHQQSRSSEQ